MKLFIVDAFTETPFGGNPAGVVILPQGGDFPSEQIMLKIAAELRYSETAFIKQLAADRFNIRYFTPAAEVDLCGHATIASFYTLLSEGYVEVGKTYLNQTLAGNLNVAISKDAILMDMAEPKLLEAIPDGAAVDELYRVMGLQSKGQGIYAADDSINLKPYKASTGLIDIMLPVADEAALNAIAPDFAALTALSKQYGVVGVHAFTVNSADGNVHARNFAPLYEIDEEAATGTSNGALAYYLYRHGILKEDQLLTVVQGEKMQRPSKIVARLVKVDGAESVKVGGTAVMLAKGELRL